MKINLISYNNGYGLTKDMNILKYNLEIIYSDLDIIKCDFYDHNVREADINIFFEIISNILIPKAKYNILIPNQEWFYKEWIPYLENIDLILTKTKYSSDIFSNFGKTEFIGWESEDLFTNVNKDYKSLFHSCGKSIYKQTQFIIDNWGNTFPHLTILYDKNKLDLNCTPKKNITYLSQRLNNGEMRKIMNEKGIHLCPSETEGFGHYINEARSCKSIVITTDAEPMKDFVTNTEHLIKVDKKIKLKKFFGYKNILDTFSFKKIINSLMKTDEKEMIKQGEINRENFIKDKNLFRENLKKTFDNIFDNITENVKNNNLKLPNISVVTITRNRERFVKLCLLNIFQADYPQDKIEWVIIDDSDTSIKKLLPDNQNIKYFHYDKKLNIGEKRNIGVEKSSHDYILFMDDDDYYPQESFKERISKMIEYNKDCVFCSSIGCFHINKYISIMNVPPHQLPFHQRVSEATLCFKKSFWENKKFLDDCNGAEGGHFIENRYSQCLELPPEKIIVSLLHSQNTSQKDLVIDKPNGCHFNFSDKLFCFITSLDTENNIEKEI